MNSISGEIVKVFALKDTWAAFKLKRDDIIVSDPFNFFDGETYTSCSGPLIGAVEGMKVKLMGEFQNHPKYGEQFILESFEILVGSNINDIERYLTSSAISGIGEELAKRIIAKFGTSTIDIIHNDYLRLTEVDGIGKKTAVRIHDSEANSQVFQVLLSYANVTPRQALTLYEHYKEDTINIIKKKPYTIVRDIPGFAFKTVDKIALKNGTDKLAPERIGAAITFCLNEIGDTGHCYTTIYQLEAALKDLISEVPNELLAQVLANEIYAGNVIQEDMAIYSKELYMAEDETAKNTAKLLTSHCKAVPVKTIEKSIENLEFEYGFLLEKHQKDAIYAALSNNLTVITGGPGTGKSTIIKAIVDAWTEFSNDESSVHLCAPTGKASRRMADLTKREAETVHKIINKAIFNKNKEEANAYKDGIKGHLMIVDECSMLDIYLANKILYLAVNCNLRLVLIGDTDQLPPIGPGNFFKDMCDSPCVPSITLKLCHRQRGTIAINAQRINNGVGFAALNLDDKSFRFVNATKDKARDAVINSYLSLVAQYGLVNVSCIVPMRKKGRSHTAADDLNEIIRERVNPEKPLDIKLEGVSFRIGDRVMQTQNDYERDVYNGDCGVVKEIREFDKILVVKMDAGKEVEYTVSQCSDLVLAYAITVHKSQGSEYKAIVVAHNREHAFMLERNLLYTAVTRAKDAVILVGEPSAINMATHKISSFERMRKLKLRIGTEIARIRSKR